MSLDGTDGDDGRAPPSSPPAKFTSKRASGGATGTGLASPVLTEKRSRWKPLKKIRRLFSRSGHLSELTVGEIPGSTGSVIKYTPGPESLNEPYVQRRVSAPDIVSTRSSSAGAEMARTFGEVTPNGVTSEARSSPSSYASAFNHPPTSSSPFLRVRQATEGVVRYLAKKTRIRILPDLDLCYHRLARYQSFRDNHDFAIVKYLPAIE